MAGDQGFRKTKVACSELLILRQKKTNLVFLEWQAIPEIDRAGTEDRIRRTE